MLRKKNLGNVVASEMVDVLASDEYRDLFGKEAAEEVVEEKTEVVEEVNKEAAIEVESEEKLSPKQAFNQLTQQFVTLSEALDNMGFEKASSTVLTSLQVFLKEAAGEEVRIEKMLEEALEKLNPAVDVDIDMDEPTDVEIAGETVDERLLEDEEGLSLEEQFAALEEMGLGDQVEGPLTEETKKQMKEKGLGGLAKEIAEAAQEVEAWLKKNAEDGEDGSNLELDADLSALLAADSVDDQLLSQAKDDEKKDEEDAEDEDFEDED